MEQFMNPNDPFTPEKMEEIRIKCEAFTRIFNELTPRMEESRRDLMTAAGGITPEQLAINRRRDELLCQELDAVEEQIKEFQPILNEAIEVIGDRLMAQTDAIYQKMKEASKDNPELQAEMRELDELHEKIFKDDEEDDFY